ncbi:MAG TPA: hypothetical protein VHC48_20685 [Puia sp.]|jgi:hypothetical protein|nr:hypothetical protein [Puia sp.]
MPNPKTDSGGFSTTNADQERDMGAKGGPSTSTGIPDDKHGAAAPYDADLQTQIAAKGGKKHDEKAKNKPDRRSSL